MRRLIEDILHDRRRDAVTLPLRITLSALSRIYGGVTIVRNYLYSRNWIKPDSVPCRVVSIGNITAGGTGKTPMVIMTARMLANAGYQVAVVSRGYLRKSREPLVVSDGKTIFAGPKEAGDEPHIVASALPGIPVVVGKRRYDAARLAWERFRPDMVVLDDAFQHLPLSRDVDIVTLDAERPFGNGSLLPRGVLREFPCSLARADAVIVTRFQRDPPSGELEREVRRFNPAIPIFYGRHLPSKLRRLSDGAETAPGSIKGRKIAAMSNIANPDAFRRTLESLGADIVWKCAQPDHYRYRPGDIERIGKKARQCSAEAVVMTAKDERNLPGRYGFGATEAFVLEIETALIDGGTEYLAMIAPEKNTGDAHGA